jgi:DNA polymerase IV
MKQRKIIHIDMDAFYASVEQRDNVNLRGKPIIISGPPDSRSVVCTASYEARKFGVHSAMPASQAKRLCPNGIFVPPRFSVYREISKQIQKIFFEYSDLVEPLSLDEAYIEVTENKKSINSATQIAKEIKEKIFKETDLTASAGVAGIKFIAKVASGMNKPNGITVITPDEAETFLEKLQIGKFFGIGRVTEKKMNSLGIKNGLDLKQFSKAELIQKFGKSGSFYYHIVRGEDSRSVNPNRNRKSIGAENTFESDLLDKELLWKELEIINGILWNRIQKVNFKAKTLTLKVKYDNFESISRGITQKNILDSKDFIFQLAMDLLHNTEIGIRKIRLLGLTLSNLDSTDQKEPSQLVLF